MNCFPKITVDVHTDSESNNGRQLSAPHIVHAEGRSLDRSNVDSHVTSGLGRSICGDNVKQDIHGFHASNGSLDGSQLSTARRTSISVNILDHKELGVDNRLHLEKLQPVWRKSSLKPELECSPSCISILARRGSARPRATREV